VHLGRESLVEYGVLREALMEAATEAGAHLHLGACVTAAKFNPTQGFWTVTYSEAGRRHLTSRRKQGSHPMLPPLLFLLLLSGAKRGRGTRG